MSRHSFDVEREVSFIRVTDVTASRQERVVLDYDWRMSEQSTPDGGLTEIQKLSSTRALPIG